MDETFFYIAGLALVAIALLTSFVGIRRDGFPSDAVLRIGVILVAAIVVATGFAAVNSSEQKQQDREQEQNATAAESAAEQSASNEEESGGGSASSVQEEPAKSQSGPGDNSGAGGNGAQVFVDNGCGSCHTLAEVPDANGNIGPNLDEALDGKDEAFIRTSIVDPSAFVEDGYPDGVMPQTFEQMINPTDLDALVAYLSQVTGSGSAAGSSSGSGAQSGKPAGKK